MNDVLFVVRYTGPCGFIKPWPAARYRRSLNHEAIHCLEQVLPAAPARPEAYLNRSRSLRVKTSPLPLPEKRLWAAQEQGRS
jgi:hypothetical protein